MAPSKISKNIVQKKLDEIKNKYEETKELIQKLENGLIQQKKNMHEYEGAIVVLNQLLINVSEKGSND